MEIGTETPIFLFWEYLFRNFGILSLQCDTDSFLYSWYWHFRVFPVVVFSCFSVLELLCISGTGFLVYFRHWPSRVFPVLALSCISGTGPLVLSWYWPSRVFQVLELPVYSWYGPSRVFRTRTINEKTLSLHTFIPNNDETILLGNRLKARKSRLRKNEWAEK